jgi:hypothetical protein
MTAPTPAPEQLRARALAGSRREAMRMRARRIRRAVAGLAVTLFATAFLIVYVQLASGHDPALVANAAKRRAAAVSTISTGSESTSSSGSPSGTEGASGESSETSSSTGDSSSSSGESSSGAAAVTTSQS